MTDVLYFICNILLFITPCFVLSTDFYPFELSCLFYFLSLCVMCCDSLSFSCGTIIFIIMTTVSIPLEGRVLY